MTLFPHGLAIEIKPICTESDYRKILKRIESLMEAREDSLEDYLLDVLAIQVNAYDENHYPIDVPETISGINVYME